MEFWFGVFVGAGGVVSIGAMVLLYLLYKFVTP